MAPPLRNEYESTSPAQAKHGIGTEGELELDVRGALIE